MRDIALTLIFIALLGLSFRRHYLAPLMWVWLSMMNPHRLTYGFAYSAPFAQITAIWILGIWLFSKSRKPYPWTPPSVLLLVFYAWMCITSVFAFNDPSLVFDGWIKVTKIQLVLFMSLMLWRGRDQINALVWVMVISIGFYGIKGGLFTIAKGGRSMVMGPPGSFIEGTNHIALAMMMIVPLMYYLTTATTNKWIRRGLYGSMALTSLSVLGTTSRGALLAIAAMSLLLAFKSRRKILTSLMVGVVGAGLLAAMSDQWADKMGTITTHEDQSAQSRLYTWKMIWNMAQHHPITGGGYNVTENPLTWQMYAVTEYAKAYSPHSIYFQALAEHGFVGLFIYLALGIATWRLCSRTIKMANTPDTQWAATLSRMIQTPLLGFAVGGAFVNLVNFDLVYYFVALAVLTHVALRDMAVASHLTNTAGKTPPVVTSAAVKY